MCILIVEDEAEIRQLLSEVLMDAGYTVAQATNGQEALAYLRAAPALPGLIIIDLMMPIMNGWEFLQAQRSNLLFAAIPVVVISAVQTFATAKALGAQECLLKPLDLDRLLAIVQQHYPSTPSA